VAYHSYKSMTTLVGEVCGGMSAFTATAGAGGIVDLRAVATCTNPSATAQYKFLMLPPGSSSYTEIRGWGEGSYRWTNTTGLAGNFTFVVYARDSRNLSVYEAEAKTTTQLSEICGIISSFTATASAGGVTDLSATAFCMNPTATVQYKFFAKPPGSSSYTEIRSWGEGSYRWTNTAGQSGRFTFLVYARDSRNSSAYEAYQTTTALLGETCTAISSFTATAEEGGNVVTFSANASCSNPTAMAQYRFFMLAPGGSSYMEIRTWGGSTLSWTNTTGKSGRFSLLVYARDSRNSSAYEAYKTASTLVGEVCQSVTSFTANAGAGGLVALSAEASCTDPLAPVQYRFFVRPPGSASYTEIRSWGEGSMSWMKNTLQTGTFIFLVYARDSRNLSAYEAYKTRSALLTE
jgi:hypothetical protein